MSCSPARPRRVHVLQVLGQAIVGGMESCVLQLVERLPRERFQTTVVCPQEGGLAERLRALGAEVVVTPIGEEPPWVSVQLATTLVQAARVDVLHAHLAPAHLLAALAGRLAGRPVLTTLHARQLSVLDLELLRSAGTHLNVVCRQSYYHALGLGVDPARLSCIPNGVDTARFHPRAADAAADAGLRRALELPAEAPLIGFVGRLSPEKGPEVFVRTALHLHRRWPQARFVLIGEGPQRAGLQALAERHGLQGCVHFAGLQSDMPACYRELDLVVSSSWTEALPLVLMEALASGLPVVGTRVGGVPELIAQGLTGFLAAPGDHECLAAHMATLLADLPLRRRMGDAARAWAVERLQLDESVRRTGELLERLAAGRALDGAPRAEAAPLARQMHVGG
ncbi:glycosyltransferase family 4 protein [Azohydromonas caseinilytica]|uniref:Glycosyltransferase family 4 protein n=1 Tax=Azohydromonas caseinilytica TaxID=2728836 RepID=A0A848F1F4_9BURK|nr:glycosyltransferase family 4 protein [Azohydromonas caseinilytica]NML13514.1 glycosyltransferase family 4 protein [Azohydromonas caseinilytica]